MATKFTEPVGISAPSALGRGRQSLEQSIWYSGWLLTFLATGEDTHGQFALIEAVARRGNVPPPHIHHREDETFYVLEGEATFSLAGQTIKATPETMVFEPRNAAHSFVIDSDQMRMLHPAHPRWIRRLFQRVQCAGAGYHAAASGRNSIQ